MSQRQNPKSAIRNKINLSDFETADATTRVGASGFAACLFRTSISRWRILAVFLLLAATTAEPQGLDDKQATFFMGRVKYSSNDGNDCGGVGQDLMRLVSRASTLKIQEERKVNFTDPELFETPFVFMNGHNDFTLVEAELSNLRKYLSHG